MEGYYCPLPLYVGDLSPEVTKDDLSAIFSPYGTLISVRLCRDLLTERSLCYGYVNFHNPFHAYVALRSLNHAMLMGRSMRIMFSQRDPISRKNGVGNLFVKNLDQSVTSSQLHGIFSRYGDVISCKVAEENGVSKGFGFVQFNSEASAMDAIDSLHGTQLGRKKLYVAKFMRKEQRTATTKTDSSLKSLLVRKLDKSLTEDHLRGKFCEYGKIHSVFVKRDYKGNSKGYGFVNFESQDSAAKALNDANGSFLGSRRVSLCFALPKSQIELLSRAIGPVDDDASMKNINTYIGYPENSRDQLQVYNHQQHYNFLQQWPNSYQGFPLSTTHLQAHKLCGGTGYYSQPVLCFPHGFIRGGGQLKSGNKAYKNGLCMKKI